MLPKIGVRLSDLVPARRCEQLAQIAEKSRLDSVWFAENPFGRGALPAVTLCAAATKKLRLGIGVFSPYNRHPTLMAMEAATLNEIAPGRIGLGVGGGLSKAIQQLGYQYQPASATRDALAILRQMLAGEPASYSGKVFQANGPKLGIAVPDKVALLVGGVGDRMLELAGEMSDGLIISNMCPLRYTVRACDIVRTAAQNAGRPMPEIIQYIPCAVRETRDEAHAAVKGLVGTMVRAYAQSASPAVRSAVSDYHDMDPDHFGKALQSMKDGAAPETMIDEHFIKNYAIAGTLDECITQFAQYKQAGADTIAVTCVGQPEADIAALGKVLTAR